MSSKWEVSEFSRGEKTPIRGGYMWPVMPIFKLAIAIPVKSHVWKFGSDCLSLSRVIIWIFRGGRNPLLGGLHVTCNAHFRTWLSYSSQKSSVQIWFGLAEVFKNYRVHKHFSLGQKPPIRGGHMWPAMPIFELGLGGLDKSHAWKFVSDWLRLSRVIVGTNQMTRGRGRGRGQKFLK